MIRVPCRCKFVLEVADDQAGLAVQCPRCGLLVDIPAVSDLSHINSDGTYQIDDAVPKREEDDFQRLSYIYYPGRQLPNGQEIDLRGPVGAEIPLADDSDPNRPPPERPRYDPETGELIQPLAVNHNAPPAPPPDSIPEAQRVLEYSVSPNVLEGVPHGLGVFAALMQPVNVFVMLMIAGFHLGLLVSALLAAILILLLPVPLVFIVLLGAHYATVVQETGLWERDELPRPLRNLQLYDDIIGPFLQMAGALLLCYWPAGVILIMNNNAAVRGDALPFPNAGLWLILLHGLGSLLMPAMLLTVCTSGTAANLRPDRVLGVITTIGWRYVLLAATWLIGGAVYLVGQLAALAGLAMSLSPASSSHLLTRVYVAYPLLLVGLWLIHAFCWLIGLEYRRFHSVFPWVMQRHQPKLQTVQRPALHPKLSHADAQAAKRASQRRQVR